MTAASSRDGVAELLRSLRLGATPARLHQRMELAVSFCVALSTLAHASVDLRPGHPRGLAFDLGLLAVLTVFWLAGPRRDSRPVRLALLGALLLWLAELCLSDSLVAPLWFFPACALVVAMVRLRRLPLLLAGAAVLASLAGWPDRSLVFVVCILSAGVCMALVRMKAVQVASWYRFRLEAAQQALALRDIALVWLDSSHRVKLVLPGTSRTSALVQCLAGWRHRPLPDTLVAGYREALHELLTAAAGAPVGGTGRATVRMMLGEDVTAWVDVHLLQSSEAGRLVALDNVQQRHAAQLALDEASHRLAVQERELQDQFDATRNAMRVRDDMERLARHDLRAPLKSIRASLQMARGRTDLPADHQQLLAAVERTATRALAMTSLSLDLYRMEEGLYQLRPEPFDAVALVGQVIDDLRQQAASKRVAVEFLHDQPVLPVSGNELLTMSIVENLTRNAIEAAPAGSRVSLCARAAADGGVELAIHNQGEVPAEVRDRFFEKYATHGKPGGSGLGGYSAQLATRAQAGRLTMRTGPVEGTELLLWLPAPPPEPPADGAPAGAAADAASGTRPELLLVDDDESHWIQLQAQLGERVNARYAPNGQAAIDALIERRPDIVVMDLTMPVMGGFEALGTLREMQQQAHEAPSVVLAFTGRDDPQTLTAIDKAGFDGRLEKPLKACELDVWLQGRGRELAAPNEGLWIEAGFLAAFPDYLASRRALIDRIEAAHAQGDMAALRSAAHTLAGSPAIQGFAAARRLCRELECMEPGRGSQWVGERVAALRDAFGAPAVRD